MHGVNILHLIEGAKHFPLKTIKSQSEFVEGLAGRFCIRMLSRISHMIGIPEFWWRFQGGIRI